MPNACAISSTWIRLSEYTRSWTFLHISSSVASSGHPDLASSKYKYRITARYSTLDEKHAFASLAMFDIQYLIKEWLDTCAILYPCIKNILKQSMKIVTVSVHQKWDRLVIYWHALVIQMKASLKLWRRRFLTPLGKIKVVKSLILPKIIHLLMALQDPELNILNNINGLFFDFLWNGKSKIKKSVMVKQYCKGKDCFLWFRIYKISTNNH